MRILLCCFFIFLFSFKTEKRQNTSDSSKLSDQNDTTQIKVQKNVPNVAPKKIIQNDVYKIADSLNVVLFGKELDYLDFSTTSKKIPYCVQIFDFKELVKIRAFKEQRFSKSYIPNYIDNYVYFIFEYPSEEIAKKILQQYSEEVKMMDKIAADEIPFETLSERQIKSYNNSKHGGFIFNRNKTIIYVKEDCSEPNTSTRMSWTAYEKGFLNSFLHTKKHSIVGTVCGDYGWGAFTLN